MSVESLYIKLKEDRICQGDIFEKFEDSFFNVVDGGIDTVTVEYPYVIVISQDCDLMQDFKHRLISPEERAEKGIFEDKFLHSVLVIPVFLAEQLKNGEHLTSLGIKRTNWIPSDWNKICLNENKRFHFLKKDEDFQLSNLCADFKQFFTVSRDVLYSKKKSNYKASLREMFREDFSLRFAQFTSRVGLPDITKRAN